MPAQCLVERVREHQVAGAQHRRRVEERLTVEQTAPIEQVVDVARSLVPWR
jgi:hypothetical protein